MEKKRKEKDVCGKQSVWLGTLRTEKVVSLRKQVAVQVAGKSRVRGPQNGKMQLASIDSGSLFRGFRFSELIDRTESESYLYPRGFRTQQHGNLGVYQASARISFRNSSTPALFTLASATLASARISTSSTPGFRHLTSASAISEASS